MMMVDDDGSGSSLLSPSSTALGNSTSSTFCDLFSKDSYCATIITVRQVAASLSLIGCFFILCCIWVYQRYQTLGQKLILFLTVSALINTIFYFLGDTTQEASPQCTAQGFFITYFDWVVLLWDVCLTHFVMSALVSSSSVALKKREKTYHLVCWIVPAVFAVIPLFFHAYGPAGAWCWVVGEQKALRFIIWYIPMLVTLIGIAVAYVIGFRRLNKSGSAWSGFERTGGSDDIRADVNAVKWYPIVYAVLSLFAFINRIQNAANPDSPHFGLYLLHALSTPLQGLFNSLVYARHHSFKNFGKTLKARLGKSEVQEYRIMQDDFEDHDSDSDIMH